MPARTDLFGQLWKEYALSDSRYLTRDGFMVCMEGITAFAWGPLSFLISYFILTDSPYRHPTSIIVSLGQIYGDVLYFGIAYFNEKVYDLVYCRPEAFYFYTYYIFLNSIWLVIPAFVLVNSICATAGAFRQLQQTTKSKKKA
jgi:cholestenol delta-isomerase